jgi:hypothetical protein
MKRQSLSTIIGVLTLFICSCNKKKVESPAPVEQELITTLTLKVFDPGTGDTLSFRYFVPSGFSGGSMASSVDTIKLAGTASFAAAISLANEQATPVEDVTAEVIQEKNKHLFSYNSVPETGPGSIVTANGDLDDNQMPFNRQITLTTQAPGQGSLTIKLIHEPADKLGANPAAIGGETDAEAVFPVIIY